VAAQTPYSLPHLTQRDALITSPVAIRDQNDPLWCAFVESRSEATVFHLPVWSGLLGEAYGYRPLVLVQTNSQGNIVAGLPLLELRSPITGRRFSSLPFTDYCPPLARDATSLTQLTAGITQWWETAGKPRIEIRGVIAPGVGVHRVSAAVRHTLALDPDSQQLLRRCRRDSRASIHRARRDGVEVRITRSPGDLASFYRLHLQTRRRLGVPVQPVRFLEALWAKLIEPGWGFAVLASAGGRPIAGAIFLTWNRHLIYKYSASDPAYWRLRPSKLVVWTAIEWGCRHGYRLFDFGKTDLDDAGLRDFKNSWGSTEVPVTYSYFGPPPPGPGRGAATRALAQVIRASPPIVCRVIGELLYGHFG
jgi:CelD/BcsL family acetyltransferase involved in cellulose biosynthesis